MIGHKIIELFKDVDPNLCLQFDESFNAREVFNVLGLKTIPNLHTYKNNKTLITKKFFSNDEIVYTLFYDGEQCMSFSEKYFGEVFQVYAHYELAQGHCITTGLGFALRETWLLSNPKVTKLTVLEKNKDLIEYHHEYNPDLIDQIELIHCDASEYKGKCDTLLLDHYENEPFDYIVHDVEKCAVNIQHDTLWFWPLEEVISLKGNPYLNYQRMKRNLPTLADVSESKLDLYCKLYYWVSNLND